MIERKLAVSKAGHDKGKVYVIVREEENFFWLADGVGRSAAQPKKKNKKHVQPILRIPPEVGEILAEENEPEDLIIKRAIKAYLKIRNA